MLTLLLYIFLVLGSLLYNSWYTILQNVARRLLGIGFWKVAKQRDAAKTEVI